MFLLCYNRNNPIQNHIAKATPTQNHSVGVAFLFKEEKVMEETNRSMPMPLWKWNNLR